MGSLWLLILGVFWGICGGECRLSVWDNPDWALIFKDEQKIYFVAETKKTGKEGVDIAKLSVSEQQKIKCSQAHFQEFDDVAYKVVSKVGDLVD